MRRLVHISDLHFGALRPETVEPVLRIIEELGPDVVVVSGDLTQRATRAQFERARAFLDRVACRRQIVVPGNHDIPLWNLWRRFTAPRGRFDRYITDDLYPTTFDEEVGVVGLNTARATAIANGRINVRQLEEVARRFRRAPAGALRVLTCHHPFVLPEGISARKRAGRSDMALAALVEHEVDLLLTGHRHVPWVSRLGTPLTTVHAGTTTSHRTRGGAANSFNDILVESARVTVRRFGWSADAGRFEVEPEATHEFGRDRKGRANPERDVSPAPAPQ